MIKRLHGIVIDVETGGFDETEVALLSVGMVCVIAGRVVDCIEVRIAPAPGLRIELDAVAVNGYDAITWGGVDELAALTRLRRWIEQQIHCFGGELVFGGGLVTWIGFNVPFDRRFLRAAERRQADACQLTTLFSHRDMDVRGLAMIPFLAGDIERTSLDTLCEMFRIRRAQPHNAMSDCLSTLVVLCALLARMTWRPDRLGVGDGP